MTVFDGSRQTYFTLGVTEFSANVEGADSCFCCFSFCSAAVNLEMMVTFGYCSTYISLLGKTETRADI